MAEFELSRRFVDERVTESAPQHAARTHALELGLHPVSPAIGAQLAFVAAAGASRRIIEIGSTAGVTSSWLARGASAASFTCIDRESEYLAGTRAALRDCGVASSRIRCITGRPVDVLPRMSEHSYDLVLVADALSHVAAHMQHALRIVRPGGTILLLNALHGSRVADPAKRDPITTALRSMLRELSQQPDLVVSLLPHDGGLLQVAALPVASGDAATGHLR